MNEDEAKRLVEAYADMILRISMNYLKNTYDAEDICQTVFLKLLTQGMSFADDGHEKAWVIRLAINACKDHLKSAFRKRTAPFEDAQELSAPERTEPELLEELMKLPRSYRMSLYLHYYEGYSVKEIAAMLHKSENAVAACLSRGRRRLQEELLRSPAWEGTTYTA